MQTQGGKTVNPTRSPNPGAPGTAVRTALQPGGITRRLERPEQDPRQEPAQANLKSVGYGLPCAKCRTYYDAMLGACPICKSTERVSAQAGGGVADPCSESQPDGGVLDAERERFLLEFKAKLYAAHRQINPTAQLNCALAEEGGTAHEPASVCKGCYDRLQERADLSEAALHMDLKEATQIIYEAVWADPTDSSKTYRNAAQALLNELRRRAGIATVLGPLQPLSH